MTRRSSNRSQCTVRDASLEDTDDRLENWGETRPVIDDTEFVVHNETRAVGAVGIDGRVHGEVLTVLTRAKTPVTIDELVDHFAIVGGFEDDLPAWCAIHERLYTIHLPILDATGALEFDPTRGIVDV